MDVDWLRLQLLALQASEDGISYLDTHYHETETTFSGITFARKVVFINSYTIEFEDGAYAVTLDGANTNLLDVKVFNQVSVAPSNSAGLIVRSSGSGLSAEQDAALTATSTRVEEMHGLGGYLSGAAAVMTNLGSGVWSLVSGARRVNITTVGDPETTGTTITHERDDP